MAEEKMCARAKMGELWTVDDVFYCIVCETVLEVYKNLGGMLYVTPCPKCAEEECACVTCTEE